MKIIGIVMRLEKLDHAYKWFVNESYLNALENLNAAVFPICSYESLKKAVKCCSGLIIPGGYDVHGYYINEKQDEHAVLYPQSMDHFDFTCIEAFDKAKKPILGICRGMQVLNIYYKGTILQNINQKQHSYRHLHEITIHDDSFLAKLYAHTLQVNSYHHQCVNHLGEDLFPAAYSKDHILEAFEHKNKRVIGVQWHPEKMKDDQIFPYFLDVLCS